MLLTVIYLAAETTLAVRDTPGNGDGPPEGPPATRPGNSTQISKRLGGVYYWHSVASSSDGTKLVASEGIITSRGNLYTSTDSGATWTARESARDWTGVASSSDGSKLVAAVRGGHLYTSTDSGVTWTARGLSLYWTSVASSSDGSKLVACFAYGRHLYTSTDSGATWAATLSLDYVTLGYYWSSVASSSDGSKLVAAAQYGQLYTSTDSGVTWTARDSARDWGKVVSSSDGSKLVAAVHYGKLYTSTDSGATWTARESARDWSGVASSSDGSKLVAAVHYGQLYTSTDSGVTWTARDSARDDWHGVASSSDGSKLVAAVYGGQLYTSTDSGATWKGLFKENRCSSLWNKQTVNKNNGFNTLLMLDIALNAYAYAACTTSSRLEMPLQYLCNLDDCTFDCGIFKEVWETAFRTSMRSYGFPDAPSSYSFVYSEKTAFCYHDPFCPEMELQIFKTGPPMNAIIIAARGTEPSIVNLNDLFSDFSVVQKKQDTDFILSIVSPKGLTCPYFGVSGSNKNPDQCPGVHYGFMKAMISVSRQVASAVMTLQGTSNKIPIYLTGHSYGGALATLLAAHLKGYWKYNVQGVYTYGSPRVGDGKFYNAYNALALNGVTHRFSAGNDIIAHVPFTKTWLPVPGLVPIAILGSIFTKKYSYQHVGKSYHLVKKIPAYYPISHSCRSMGYVEPPIINILSLDDALADHSFTGSYRPCALDNCFTNYERSNWRTCRKNGLDLSYPFN